MNSFISSGKIKSKNTKIARSLFLALTIQLSIVVIGLSHSGYAQAGEPFKTYENPKFGLTLSYPPTWSVDELRKDPAAASNNSIVAIFKSPKQGNNDTYLENVIINIQGPRSDIKSLETYTQNSLKEFNNMSDTIKILKSDADTLAGIPARELIYSSTGIPGLNLQKMQVFTVLNNNTAYVVTYGAEQPEFQRNIQNIEKLINSIKIDGNAMKNVKEGQNQPS